MVPPPGSRLLRDPASRHQSQLHAHLHVFCEDYLQMESDLDLFLEFFYCNRHVQYSGGPLLECRGMTIQKRGESIYPSMKLMNHPVGWQKSFFYYRDTSPPNEDRLPGYRVDRLEWDDKMNSVGSDEARANLEPIFRRIKLCWRMELKPRT